MKSDSIRLIFSYIMAFAIWAGTYYALVVYPYVLDADVKLFLTGSAGAATLFIFGDQVANRTRQDQSEAYTKGLNTPVPSPFVCPVDGQSFSTQEELTMHLTTVHA